MNKRRLLGNLCMGAGTLLILAVLVLFLYNRQVSTAAGQTALLTVEAIEEARAEEAEPASDAAADRQDEPEESEAPEEESSVSDPDVVELAAQAAEEPDSADMTVVTIDGYDYVGTLSIPVLGLELPVMSAWTDDNLKVSPCRYYGSTGTDDLVIVGHNYTTHFGTLKNLYVGDDIYFTDMDGVTWHYQVAEMETLEPTAVEEMTSSGYALTLFTCTWSGQTRLTIRCDLVE